MKVNDRMRMVKLLEKMNQNKQCSNRLGLKDVSTFKAEKKETK